MIAELDDPVAHDLAGPRRADPPREVDQGGAGGPRGLALDGAESAARRCGLGDGALPDVVGVPRQARRHVLPGLRRVDDDPDAAWDPVQHAGEGRSLGINARILGPGRTDREPAVADEREVRPLVAQLADDGGPPCAALAVLALEGEVVDRHVDEGAGHLHVGEQPPAVAIRDPVEGREPLRGVRVTHQCHRERRLRVAVHAVRGPGGGLERQAAIRTQPFLVVPHACQRRAHVLRQLPGHGRPGCCGRVRRAASGRGGRACGGRRACGSRRACGRRGVRAGRLRVGRGRGSVRIVALQAGSRVDDDEAAVTDVRAIGELAGVPLP